MEVQFGFVASNSMHVNANGYKIDIRELGVEPCQPAFKIGYGTGWANTAFRIDKQAGMAALHRFHGIAEGGDRLAGVFPVDGKGPDFLEERVLLHLPVLHDGACFLFKTILIQQQWDQAVPPGMVVKIINCTAIRTRAVLLPQPYPVESPLE